MTPSAVAVALILAGGIVPLLLGRRLLLLRIAGAGGIGLGSLLGCIDAARLLVSGTPVSASWPYLQTFELSFSVDPLAAGYAFTTLWACLTMGDKK